MSSPQFLTASHERIEAKGPDQRSAVKAASQRSRSRAARALTVHRWSSSGLPCSHDRTSCRTRATRRYLANDGARNVDFECFSVRAAPVRFIRCRCSAIRNDVQTNTCNPDGPERDRCFYLAVAWSMVSPPPVLRCQSKLRSHKTPVRPAQAVDSVQVRCSRSASSWHGACASCSLRQARRYADWMQEEREAHGSRTDVASRILWKT
jgi:hypothetical protein